MNAFERLLWATRWLMLLPVVALLIGASFFALESVVYIYHALTGHAENPVVKTIQALDASLLSAVFVIFALGLYELFIAELKIANGVFDKVLEVTDLDDLKSKLGKVVVMLLIVKFFELAQLMEAETPLEMIQFAGAIALLALALWFIRARGE